MQSSNCRLQEEYPIKYHKHFYQSINRETIMNQPTSDKEEIALDTAMDRVNKGERNVLIHFKVAVGPKLNFIFIRITLWFLPQRALSPQE